MSQSVNYLHSHSGLERMLKDNDLNNKSHVLIDEKFKGMFADGATPLKPFRYNHIQYYKVPIMAFVKKGGVFKNLDV